MTEQENKRKRGAVKAALTRFKNYFDALDINNTDLIQLESRFQNFVPLLTQFEEIQMQIELEDKDFEDNKYQYENERRSFETDYYEYQSKAKRVLNSYSYPPDCSSVSQPNVANVTGNFKLPTINLPTFEGSYDQWLFFRDTFNSIVHNSTSLSSVEKFHYLRLSLKGEAASVISSLEICEENYDTAWQLLKNRYENKPLLINNHVEALFVHCPL